MENANANAAGNAQRGPLNRSFLEAFVRPSSAIKDEQQRIRSRLLAIILMVILIAGGAVIAFYVLQNLQALRDRDAQLSMLALALMLVAYLLNRWGKVSVAALWMIATSFALFALVPFVPNARQNFIYFGIVPILLTAVFFSSRNVMIVTAAFIAVTMVRAQFPSELTTTQVIDANITIIFSSALVITFMNHYHRMEGIRRTELEEANRKLRVSEMTLERRVQERTRDLKIASDVSRQATTVLEMGQLLPSVVSLTQTGFGLYAVHVFLYQPDDERLVLAAATGAVGDQMVNDGFTLGMADAPSLVAQAARKRQAVVANNVVESSFFMPNPLLPGTKAEIALPLMVGPKLVGILDLQSDQVDRFQSEEIDILTTLAEQMATAIRNAQLYDEAEAARLAAEEANKTKSQFLANMSHELRTPLNAILNFTEFVADGVYGDVNSQQETALRQTLSSGEHLLSLINDVLDLTKIEAGMMELFIEQVDLNSVLASVISVGKGLVNDKPVQLITDIGDLPQTYGDKRRIRQIFLNLVSNAVKFTRAGSVSISARSVSGSIQVSVTDTGIGIAPDDEDRVFESFKQAKHDLTGAVGTGLGMPISKYFVELHGGRIWFKSQPGVGTTFYVILPVLSAEQADTIRVAETPQAAAMQHA